MSDWIDVKESLPDGSKLFIPLRVLLKSGDVRIARRTWDEWVGANDICIQYVTHWMPIPEQALHDGSVIDKAVEQVVLAEKRSQQ